MGSTQHEEALAAAAERPLWHSERFDLVHPVLEGRCELHIWPEDDLQAHKIEAGNAEQICECGVLVEENEHGAWIYVHSAFDGREIIEELEAIPL